MKKFLLILCVVLFITIWFNGCSNRQNDDNTTTSTTVNSVISSSTTTTSTTVPQTEQPTNQIEVNNTSTTTTTKKNQGNGIISDEDMEKIENSNAEVFFSDNPNNKYIVTISNKYGVKKENLVALVKVNAEFPSATVLEFSGKKDANGELLMTYDELKNVYEINESKNTIVKASKNGLNNDGVNFVEAKILVTLAKEYFIPELPNLKANKRYHE